VKKLILIITIFAIISSLLIFILNYKPQSEKILSPIGHQPITSEKTKPQLTAEEKDIIKITNENQKLKECKTIQKGGWIPYWAYQNSLSSIKNKFLNIISPVVFQLNQDGKLYMPRNNNNLTTLYKVTNIQIYPTFSTFDPDNLHVMLTKHESEAVNTLVKHVVENNLAGVDIDIESIYVDDKDLYFQFLDDLQKQLHKNNKKLSVTVLAKWGNNINYKTFPETRKVQNYYKIGEIADSVRIMAYDYTSSLDKTPGPVAPLNWINQVLVYSLKYIPASKLWLGINTYGYEWVQHPEGKVTTGAYQWGQIKDIITDPTVSTQKDLNSGEDIATYSCLQNSRCVMYYTTPTNVTKKLNMAKHNCLKGVFFWSIDGKEGDIF
jgi:spore germination protein